MLDRGDESNFAEDGRDLLVLRKDFCDCERRERDFSWKEGKKRIWRRVCKGLNVKLRLRRDLLYLRVFKRANLFFFLFERGGDRMNLFLNSLENIYLI